MLEFFTTKTPLEKSMAKQPEWELVANLGDVSPVDYGGYFVYRDKTGVCVEEAEVLIPTDEYNADEEWTVYRFPLDKCTYINGVLSDNKFHPDCPAWFARPEKELANRPQDSTYLSRVASFVGVSVEELEREFCSDDPCERAHAYRAVGEYHGWDNFDQYPLTFTDRAEVEERYKDGGGV